MKSIFLATLAVATPLLVANAREAANRDDIAAWQGTWLVVSMETDGDLAPPEKLAKIKLTVDGTDYHFQNGSFHEHGSYKFDAAARPKALDIVVGDGPDKGKVHLAIYKIEGDRLTLGLDAANKKRPDSFDAAKGTGRIVEVWKRAKP